MTCTKLLKVDLSDSPSRHPSYRRLRYLARVADLNQLSAAGKGMGMLLCASFHVPQTDVTHRSAPSLQQLPGRDSRWPSTLHELSFFHQSAVYPTASSSRFTLGDRQPKSRAHPASAHLQTHGMVQGMPSLVQRLRRCRDDHSQSMSQVHGMAERAIRANPLLQALYESAPAVCWWRLVLLGSH